MKSRFIQNEILVLLSDKKEHTAQEIADTLEISVRTVYRHINDLSESYPITTGCSSSFEGSDCYTTIPTNKFSANGK